MSAKIVIEKLELTNPEMIFVQIVTAPGMLTLLTAPELAEKVGLDIRTLEVHIDNGEFLPVYTGNRNLERYPMWQVVLWQIGKMRWIPDLVEKLTREFGIEYNPTGHALMKMARKTSERKKRADSKTLTPDQKRGRADHNPPPVPSLAREGFNSEVATIQ